MNQKININLYFSDDGEDIQKVLINDFMEFLNNYVNKFLK